MTRAVRPLLALALAPLLAGFSPFEAEQPDVRAGNERLAAGDAAGALPHYDAAERAVGPRAEIDFDRGNALAAQGRLPEARAAWERALAADARGPGTLSSRTLQNLGTALAAAGDREGAVRAFSEALRRDPANEDARYNLEVLLRRPPEQPGAPPQAGGQGAAPQQGPPPPQAGAPPKDGQGGAPEPPRAGTQQPPAQERPAAPQPESGRDGGRREQEAGTTQRETRPEEAPGGEPAPGPDRGGDGQDARGAAPGDLDRRQAERFLDALRSRERPLPLGPASRGGEGRRDVEKDW